ncbi:MAG: hypothetical protein Q9215_004720 [Flavoplaca cf. flavocitrina]
MSGPTPWPVRLLPTFEADVDQVKQYLFDYVTQEVRRPASDAAELSQGVFLSGPILYRMSQEKLEDEFTKIDPKFTSVAVGVYNEIQHGPYGGFSNFWILSGPLSFISFLVASFASLFQTLSAYPVPRPTGTICRQGPTGTFIVWAGICCGSFNIILYGTYHLFGRLFVQKSTWFPSYLKNKWWATPSFRIFNDMTLKKPGT